MSHGGGGSARVEQGRWCREWGGGPAFLSHQKKRDSPAHAEKKPATSFKGKKEELGGRPPLILRKGFRASRCSWGSLLPHILI